MKYGTAEFAVASAGKFGQAFHNLVGRMRDEFRDHVIVESREKLAVAGKKAAIKQGDCKLGIRRVELAALGERARSRAEF